MELLLAILLKLGFFYTPEQIDREISTAQMDVNVQHAEYIIDKGLYSYDEDGGVVIEDDVDPNN